MKSVLITGTNRGIGLELVKQLINLSKPPQHVIATCKNRVNATHLQEIAEKNKNVHILEIDVQNFDEYPDLVKNVENIVGDEGLNVLINNAGISTKFTTIRYVKVKHLREAFDVNTIAPLMLTKAHLPLLIRAAEKNKNLPMGISRAAVINVSSILGSIEKLDIGGYYPYRCSKCALNIGTKTLSLDLKKEQILVTSLHPGWCKTDLGGKKAPLAVDYAVSKILKTLNALKQEHNGCFLAYDGKQLPW